MKVTVGDSGLCCYVLTASTNSKDLFFFFFFSFLKMFSFTFFSLFSKSLFLCKTLCWNLDADKTGRIAMKGHLFCAVH